MKNHWRISGILMVTLIVVFLTGATYQQAAASRPDPEMMGLLTEPVPLAAFSNGSPVQAQAAQGTPRWSNWTGLQGYTTSAPSVAAAAADRVFLFARDESGLLVWSRWDGRAWTTPAAISSAQLDSAPSCASWGTSRSIRLSCFAVINGSGALQHIWYNGESWSGWQNLGGVLTSAPGAVSWNAGVVSAFVRGADMRMYQRYYDGRSWSAWIRHDGELTSAPSCASWAETRVDCVVRGNGNNLYHKTWESGPGKGWGGWNNLGGGVNSAPSIVDWGVNRLSVFYRGDNGMMMHRYWDGTRWVGPEDLGGPIASSPACASPVVNRIECYAQGIDPAYNAGPALIQRVWSSQ
jgi:hypothetical protein